MGIDQRLAQPREHVERQAKLSVEYNIDDSDDTESDDLDEWIWGSR